MFKRFLQWMFPSLICKEHGHAWCGFESIGPHQGDGGGVFYSMRYVVQCATCGKAPNADEWQHEVSSPVLGPYDARKFLKKKIEWKDNG